VVTRKLPSASSENFSAQQPPGHARLSKL
jgi:hypothetical protein